VLFPVSCVGCYRYKRDDFGTVVCRGADFFEPVEDFRAGCRVRAVRRVDEDRGRVPRFFKTVGVWQTVFEVSING